MVRYTEYHAGVSVIFPDLNDGYFLWEVQAGEFIRKVKRNNLRNLSGGNEIED